MTADIIKLATSREAKGLWSFVVRHVGGLHDFWPLWIIIHDAGVTVAWRQRQRLRIAFRRPGIFEKAWRWMFGGRG